MFSHQIVYWREAYNEGGGGGGDDDSRCHELASHEETRCL